MRGRRDRERPDCPEAATGGRPAAARARRRGLLRPRPELALALGEDDQAAAGTGEDRLQRGQEVVAHPAAQEAGIAIAGVVDRLEPEGRAVREGGLAPDPEQRPGQPALALGHRPQAPRGGAGQEPHEHRLRLVVGGVTQRDRAGPDPVGHLGECPMAGSAGLVLEGGSGGTWTATASKSSPRRRARAATGSASAAEPGRRPWSTWTTWRCQPRGGASRARASTRAVESGPPLQATTTDSPGSRLPAIRRGGRGAADAAHRGDALRRRQPVRRRGGTWIRTRDIPGMSRVLYHLSYTAGGSAGGWLRDPRPPPDAREGEGWLRRLDSNQRPSGYEPDELPLLHAAEPA